MYIIFIIISKLISYLSNLLRVGSGYTLPGYFVLKFYPGIFKEVRKRFKGKVVLISGTNGKTTTSKLVTHILKTSGRSVLHNETGANLKSGVLSSLLVRSTLSGNIPYEYAVFEIDEQTVPYFMHEFYPDVLCLLNLSRDQLDRNWETDVVFDKWVRSLASSAKKPLLVMDESCPIFKDLADKYEGKYLFFGANKDRLMHTDLKGVYNAKNANCAVAVAECLGVEEKAITSALRSFSVAYGRGETIAYAGKDYSIFLAKNPESMNQNLTILKDSGEAYDAVLYVLNDSIPDGKDVSWIYDIHTGLVNVSGKGKRVYVSGTRALDMAVRLRYASVPIEESFVEEDLRDIISIINSEEEIKSILVLPNYSAMLELRKILVGRSIL